MISPVSSLSSGFTNENSNENLSKSSNENSSNIDNQPVLKNYERILKKRNFCIFQELLDEPDMPIKENYELVEVNVKICNKEFMLIIDTGSEVSVVNEKIIKELKVNNSKNLSIVPAQNISIVSATGIKHKKVNKQVILDVGFEKMELPIVFLIVDDLNTDLIVGCDFLKEIKGIVNFEEEKVVIKKLEIPFIKKPICRYGQIFNIKVNADKRTNEEIWDDQILNIRHSLQNESKDLVEKLIDVFDSNKDVFSDSPGSAKGYVCKLRMKDDIKLIKKSYPIPYNQRDAVREELNKMLSQKIIEPGCSEYTNPMVVVKKPNNSIRLCLDGREVNKFILRDYTEPEPIDSLLIRFNQCNYITSLDLTQGFNQVKLDEDSKKFVAFNVFGQVYQYTHLPFGLNISSSEFIKCLYKILGEDVCQFIIAYVDDLAICSKTLEEHIQRLDLLFKRLKEGNLTLKLAKSKLIADKIKYLGYVISKEGIEPDQDKLRVIKDFPEPSNLKQLQSFLGFCNYYRKFQKNYSYLTAEFKHLLNKNKKFIWTDKERKVFNEIKEKFIDCVMLRHPDYNREFIMSTDCSDIGIGVELFQENNEKEHEVIAYASRSLNKSELNYSICEKECLSVLFGLQKFQNYFGDRKIIVRTDHKALTFMKKCKVGHSRMGRWILALQNYNIEWEYIPGKENIVADIISRTDFEGNLEVRNSNEYKVFNIIKSDKPMNEIIKKIKNTQYTDPWINKIKDKVEMGNVQICKYFTVHEDLLFCRKTTKNNYWKLCVPSALYEDLIMETHYRQGHVGISKVCRFLQETFYIKDCYKMVTKTIKYCKYCQLVKTSNEKKLLDMHTIISEKKNSKIFIDVYGELPGGRYKWMCIILDGFTKHVKLYPLVRANSKTLIKKVEEYIKEFGKFEYIISDNGTCFQSRIWKSEMERLGIKPYYISMYHPQANLSERPLKEVNRILRTYVPKEKHNTWYKHLDKAEYIINCNFHETTGQIPVEMMMNKKLGHLVFKSIRFPPDNKFELEPEELRNRRVLINIKNKGVIRRFKQNMRNKNPCKINVGDQVLIKNYILSNKLKKISAKLCAKYKGPYVVVKDLRKGCYELEEIKTGKILKVNKFMMKRFYHKDD